MTHYPKRRRREAGKIGPEKPPKDERTWFLSRERKKQRQKAVLMETLKGHG